jgi:hypothetical protein
MIADAQRDPEAAVERELGLDPRANEVRNVGPRVSRIF